MCGSRGCTARPDAYVELHIEQGESLGADAPLGVVTAIVGYVRGRRTFTGTAGHAGTTPMDVREDALVQAAEFVLHARDVARGIEGAVATVGQLTVEPGGTNVIPGRVVLSVDAELPTQSGSTASRRRSRSRSRPDRALTDVGGDPGRAAGRGRGARPARARASLGAGHDAGILATAGIPSGMLFVRSLNGGVSHNPDEFSSPEDIALARRGADRSTEEAGEVKAVVVKPGEGHRVGNIEFLARSADTPRFNLAIITIQPHSGGPPPHSHAAEDDSFYILEGELTFGVEGEEVVAGPGTFVLVPPQAPAHLRQPRRHGGAVRQRARAGRLRPPDGS